MTGITHVVIISIHTKIPTIFLFIFFLLLLIPFFTFDCVERDGRFTTIRGHYEETEILPTSLSFQVFLL
jgi:hypothetical protein